VIQSHGIEEFRYDELTLDFLQDHLFTFWGVMVLLIIVSEVGRYIVKWKRLELESELKREMLARGMSAEEIKTVMDAGNKRQLKAADCRSNSSADSIRQKN